MNICFRTRFSKTILGPWNVTFMHIQCFMPEDQAHTLDNKRCTYRSIFQKATFSFLPEEWNIQNISEMLKKNLPGQWTTYEDLTNTLFLEMWFLSHESPTKHGKSNSRFDATCQAWNYTSCPVCNINVLGLNDFRQKNIGFFPATKSTQRIHSQKWPWNFFFFLKKSDFSFLCILIKNHLWGKILIKMDSLGSKLHILQLLMIQLAFQASQWIRENGKFSRERKSKILW